MAFSPRDIAAIRDQLLAYWASEYAAAGEVLLTTAGSDAFIMAAMIAVVQNACDVQAQQVARDILPDQASDSAIARFGYVYGIARLPGVASRETVTVTGTPSATITIPAGSTLSWTDGTLYQSTSTSVTLSGGGSGTINVTATTTGLETTRTVGDTLTWQSAPAGLNPTGVVASVVTAGDDAETFQQWAQRIVSRLRERPASGNRADWAAWVQAYTALDIQSVYVYPLVQPVTDTPLTLGCVTVVAVGPAQGDSVTNSRVLGGSPGSPLTEVIEYIEGTRTATGLVTATGTQLRPVTMSADDFTVDAIDELPQAVTVFITVNGANAFPFSFTATVGGTSTPTSLVLTGADYTTGATNLTNQPVLLEVGTAAYRGGIYRVVLPSSGVYAAGDTTFTLPTALPATPTGTLRAPPGNWNEIRTAVFDYFDNLGPGDVSPAYRWPSEDNGARATVYPSALAATVMSASGVLSAAVTVPAAAVIPAPKQVVTLGLLTIVSV